MGRPNAMCEQHRGRGKRWLTELYLSQTPLKDIPWKDILQINEIQEQKTLLHSTVFHDMCRKYPPKVEYTRKFLKRILDILEGTGADVCEELYNLYVDVLEKSSTDAQPSFSFKSYYVAGIDKFIPLLECSSFLSSGTTGLNTWPGARVLADWCIQNTNLFSNKRIVELGAGVGLTGIMVSKSCSPSFYLFTDYHEKVLKILNYNARLNFDESTIIHRNGDDLLQEALSLPWDCRHENTDISIEAVDWTDRCSIEYILKKYGNFDVILAADVVFEPSILSSLVDTMLSILHHSHQNMVHCVAYFSVIMRNMDTYEKFCSEMSSKSLEVAQVSIDCVNTLRRHENLDVKLLEIVIPPSG